jgi:hypothetical protein
MIIPFLIRFEPPLTKTKKPQAIHLRRGLKFLQQDNPTRREQGLK